MSNLSIGLVTSPSEESKQLISLLESHNIQVVYHILPEEIESNHIENDSLNVWLLNVDDEHWHDNIDQLLDESDASIYFNEPGSLDKQSHPEYWCEKLVDRLYELTGLSKDTVETPSQQLDKQKATTPITNSIETPVAEIESVDDLSLSLDELETSSVGLPSNIAAELVSELESISPDLESSIEESINLDEELLLNIDESIDIDAAISEQALEIESIDLEEGDVEELVLEPEALKSTHREQTNLAAESVEPVPFEQNDSSSMNTQQESLSSDSAPLDDIELDEFSLEISSLDSLSESLEDSNEGRSISDTVDTIQDTDLSDLSLALMEDNNDKDNISTGEASYLIDDEELQSEGLPEETHDVDDELGGLTLETMDNKPGTNSEAVYVIDEGEERIVETASIEEEVEDSGGLTLESINDNEPPVTGKAQYVIDEGLKESELVIDNEPVQINQKSLNETLNEPKEFELSLESMEQEQSDLLVDDEVTINNQITDDVVASSDFEKKHELSLETQEINMELQELSLENEKPPLIEVSDDLLELEGDTIESLNEKEQSSEPSNIQVELSHSDNSDNEKKVEEMIYEIPMLEESATGIDFDDINEEQQTFDKLTPCWVIGASLGGPAAVKRFLQSLPADINVSFIIAQHIDENFLPVLADILTSNSSFSVEVANGSNNISAGKVYLAPLAGKVIFLQDGSMLVDRSQKWSEPYSPCIDDVIGSVSAIYGDQCGAIIFSGMGQDGLRGSEKMHSLGGQIWAQSVDSCANSSMPEAVIDADLTSVIGAPEVLAEQLVNYINNLSEAI